ncbi:hypothetical protein JCM10296v2_000538 [Rhodotorula toruloides]
MLEMAVHDLTVASICDECRIELPKGNVLSWGDNPYIASTYSWKGCHKCEKKAMASTGHVHSFNVLPFLEDYGLTTEWYKHPESYDVEDYVPGYQTAEELEETEKYGLYRRFFADWPMGGDEKESEPQLHIRCVGESG